MKPAAPPLWVLALPLKPGPKLLLVTLWAHADYDAEERAESDGKPIRVWPSRRTMSTLLATPLGTIKRWLAELTEAGLVRRLDGGWELATQSEVNAGRPVDEPGRPVDEPGRPNYGPGPVDEPGRPVDEPGGPADEPGRPVDEPAQIWAGGGPDMGQGGPDMGRGGPTDGPQTLQDLPSNQPTPSTAARASTAEAANPHLAESLARHRAILGRGQQAALPGVGPAPKRNLPAEVREYMTATVASLRSEFGKPPGKPLLTTKHDLDIAARLREVVGSDDDKLDAAKRVIDVQAAQVRSRKRTPNSPEAKRDWSHLTVGHLFSPENFPKTLERWSPDGDHVLWWQPQPERARASKSPFDDERWMMNDEPTLAEQWARGR